MQTLSDVRTPGDDPSIERHVVRPDTAHEVEVGETDEGQPTITVPVSSGSEMRSGRVIGESGLEAIVDQLGSEPAGMWDDHGLDDMGWPEYRREDLYGAWVDGKMADDGTVLATARLRQGDARTDDLLDQLDQAMPVGFSVGYIPTETETVESEIDEDDGPIERDIVTDLDLLEISPVGIPDNRDAYATAGRQVASALAETGADIDREVASVVADGVTDALQTSDMTDTESTNSEEPNGDHDETPEETNEGDHEDEEEEESAGGVPGATHQDDELVEEMVGIVTDHLQEAIDDIEALADDEKDDEEESAEDDGDDDDEESEESAENDVEATIEALEAKVQRLESEARESAGRRGIATAGGTGADDVDGDSADGSSDNETTDAERPRNTYDEALGLGSD